MKHHRRRKTRPKPEDPGVRAGREAENRFFAIYRHLKEKQETPRGLLDIRKATREQDLLGIDAVVVTDIGEFFLQIKVNNNYRWRHNKKMREHGRPMSHYLSVRADIPDMRIWFAFRKIYWDWREAQEAKTNTAPD